jgi:hypothetical protein
MRRYNTAVTDRLARQHGVISREQALAEGMTPRQVTGAVDSGAWQRVHRGVFHLRGSPMTPHALLLAACLATGGRASHQSAAWLWGLVPHPPPRPTVSVRPSAWARHPGIVVHRMVDLRPGSAATWVGIPCTGPARTAVDLAGVVDRPCLDRAIDVGLAQRRFTLVDLARELARRSRRGRPGVGVLRQALHERGYTGAPHPSVLESRVLRLLAGGGVRPSGVERKVLGADGRYRLDITLADRVAMEVDGYAFHADPVAMARDHRRRNDLARQGWTVLVFTWLDVTRDGDRVLRVVRDVLASPLPGGPVKFRPRATG